MRLILPVQVLYTETKKNAMWIAIFFINFFIYISGAHFGQSTSCCLTYTISTFSENCRKIVHTSLRSVFCIEIIWLVALLSADRQARLANPCTFIYISGAHCTRKPAFQCSALRFIRLFAERLTAHFQSGLSGARKNFHFSRKIFATFSKISQKKLQHVFKNFAKKLPKNVRFELFI